MLKFTYTKTSGSVSERVGLIVAEPTENLLMLDLSDLSEEERRSVENDWETYKLLKATLDAQFEFKKYFKSFKPKGISNREVV